MSSISADNLRRNAAIVPRRSMKSVTRTGEITATPAPTNAPMESLNVMIPSATINAKIIIAKQQ